MLKAIGDEPMQCKIYNNPFEGDFVCNHDSNVQYHVLVPKYVLHFTYLLEMYIV